MPIRGEQFAFERNRADLRATAADIEHAVGQLLARELACQIVRREPHPGGCEILAPVLIGIAVASLGSVPSTFPSIRVFSGEWALHIR